MNQEIAQLRKEIKELQRIVSVAILKDPKANIEKVAEFFHKDEDFATLTPEDAIVRDIRRRAAIALLNTPEVINGTYKQSDVADVIKGIDANEVHIDGRSLPPVIRELRRVTAMALINTPEVQDGKYKMSDVAQALGTCVVTLGKWKQMALTGSLTERKRGGVGTEGKKRGRKPKSELVAQD